MPRSKRDFWPSSVRCIDQKHFPFQVFHLNHCFYLCLEHPVHKNKNTYAQDPDHFVTINCSLEDKGYDCIIMVIVSIILAVNNLFGPWSRDDRRAERRAESFNLLLFLLFMTRKLCL